MLIELIIGLAAVAFFLVARKATRAPAQKGAQFAGGQPLKEPPEVLKVATFNVQTGKSNEGRRNIARASEQLVSCDLAGIQEVYGATWLNRLGMGAAQTPSLAKLGRFNYCFNPTRRRWFRDHRGNAIVSRLPVAHWECSLLPDQTGKSYRNLTQAHLRWLGKDFVLLNTHLHTTKGRLEQLDCVLEAFAQHPRAILVGDFNSLLETPALRSLLADPNVIDAIAELGLDPNEAERIDYILVKGFAVVDGRYAPKGVSDHPYYEAHLKAV